LVDTQDTDTALRGINGTLAESELNGNYSLDLLIGGAQHAPNLFSISPIDSLRFFLAQELTRIQRELVDQVVPALNGSTPIKDDYLFTVFSIPFLRC
jgi:hypothetical protein